MVMGEMRCRLGCVGCKLPGHEQNSSRFLDQKLSPEATSQPLLDIVDPIGFLFGICTNLAPSVSKSSAVCIGIQKSPSGSLTITG
jgi:hypothetical protein